MKFKLRDIKYFFLNIIIGIYNLWTWKKVIWNDRDWEDIFLYNIMLHKLGFMEKYFRSDKCNHEGHLEIAESIKNAYDALYRISKNDYMLEEYSKYLDKPNWSLNNMSDDVKKLVRENTQYSINMTQKDFDIFCENFRKSQEWWD